MSGSDVHGSGNRENWIIQVITTANKPAARHSRRSSVQVRKIGSNGVNMRINETDSIYSDLKVQCFSGLSAYTTKILPSLLWLVFYQPYLGMHLLRMLHLSTLLSRAC